MKATTKRSLLLFTSACFASQAFANGAGFGARPSFIQKAQTAENKGTEFKAEVADQMLAARMMKNLADKKIYNVDQSVLEAITKAYVSNKGVQETIKSIQSQENFSTRDNVVREINELRLKIVSQLGEIDPFNQEFNRKADESTELASQRDLMILIIGLVPVSVSAKAKENVKSFLSEIDNALKNGARTSDALRVAQEVMQLEKGVEVNTALIQAAYRSSGGVIEIFKTNEDMAEIVVNGPNGAPMTVRMTMKRAQEVESLAHEEALNLLELAKSPDVGEAFKQKAIKDLKSDMVSTSTFIKDNPLLDRTSSKFRDLDKSKDDVAKSVDDLLLVLQDLGATVGGRGMKEKLARVLRKVPMMDKVVKDPVAWKRTLREKVIEIDNVLVDGISRLDQNNQSLGNLKARALDQMGELQASMAKTKLVADFLQHYIKQLQERGDTATANVIRSEVVPRIERELNGAMSLYGVLTASVEAMNELTRTNNMIITNSIQLRTVAAPAIAVTESVKEAGRDAERVMKQSRAISKFVENQLTEMSAQIKKNNELFAQQAGESVVNPEVLDRVLTELATERENMAKRMAEAGERLNKSNTKLVSVLNKAQQTLKQDALGVQVDGMIRGGDQNQN